MGIQINGQIDDISATDGGLTISDLEINQSGISTFNAGVGIGDSIFHLGDDNTQIRFPAADTITAETAGSERVRVASDGKVGIGTDNPDRIFHITTASPIIKLTDSDNSLSAEINGSSGNIYFDTQNSNRDIIFRGSTTEVARVTGDGKVGIGTQQPDAPLRVVKARAGTVSADGNAVLALENSNHCVLNMLSPADKSSYIMMGDPDDINAGQIRYDNNINNLMIEVNGGEKLRITSDGKLLLGTDDTGYSGYYTTMIIGDASTQNTGLTIASSPSNGYSRLHFADGNSGAARYAGWIAYNHADDALLLSAGNSGTERLRITSGGNVVFSDKDSGHIGGGFYSRTKSVAGNTTINFMRFTLTHGALAGSIYATASNNAYSISKSYSYAVQYGDGSNVNIQSDSGPMGGVDYIVSCSTSASTHTFRVQNVGSATIEVNLTVVVGCANQDITYTEL